MTGTPTHTSISQLFISAMKVKVESFKTVQIPHPPPFRLFFSSLCNAIFCFNYCFINNLSTYKNQKRLYTINLSQTLLTWAKYRKIFRQYSVKCSILSKGHGFKLSQCLNRVHWKKNDCCRYQDIEGANRVCSLFPQLLGVCVQSQLWFCSPV